jgi:hypothetical protein
LDGRKQSNQKQTAYKCGLSAESSLLSKKSSFTS